MTRRADRSAARPEEEDEPERAERSGEARHGEAREEALLERATAEQVHAVTERAIRRLDLLEYVILAAAGALAVLAGALLAFLLQAAFGWPFRSTWLVSSLVCFLVPALAVWWTERGVEEGPPVAEEGRHDIPRGG